MSTFIINNAKSSKNSYRILYMSKIGPNINNQSTNKDMLRYLTPLYDITKAIHYKGFSDVK